MSDKKIKISNILGSQIPDFIQADNPLFKEFLTQYYELEEREYGTTYISDHISSLKNISTISDISLVEKQTVPAPNSLNPESPVTLTSLIYAYDGVINVNQTTGFPEKYGLLKIDNEIITYTGKTATSFTGCVRGFSGISEISNNNNPEFLTFSLTKADTHSANSIVVNLSFTFITEFYKKFRKNFLPGLEGRSFAYGLNVENILSRAKDFYSSKGTDVSLKILFQVLYGEQIEIIKPFDQTIIPSEAKWDITDDIVVEVIAGNPLNLIGLKIYQDSLINPTASGSVSNVSTKFLGNKQYYQISFSKGTIFNKFKVSTKTKVVSTASTTEVVTVDSTIGFGETGNFYYPNAYNQYSLAKFTSKSSNQFFGCTGITTTLTESDSIIDLNFVYGYENNDLSKICQMRVVGSITKSDDNIDVTKYFDLDDSIKVKHLGEKYDINDLRFNTWFYNNLSYVDVQQHPATSVNFSTLTEHFLKIGDKVDVIYKDTGAIIKENIEVNNIASPKEFTIDTTVISDIIFGDYIIKKKLNYASSNFGITSLLSNIQNSFVDSDKNAYVAFSGYPSFDTQTSNRSKSFTFGSIDANGVITINDHNFLNGEKVYVGLSTVASKGSSGYYYVNVVDKDSLRLSLNNSNLYENLFEVFLGTGSDLHSIIPADLYRGEKLTNQNHFKRIYKTPKIKTENTNISGQIGVSLNGVEYHSPLSKDSVFYGQIDNIEVLDSGSDFNVIQSPSLKITDTSGSGCIVNPNFTGSISEIVLDKSGFNYLDTPSVKIVGGNGSGAICEAKMRGFIHQKIFDEGGDIDTDTNTINGEHKFSDGEEVTYIASGTPIGVGETNAGIGSTDRLRSETSYFIAKIDENSFRLAVSEQRAISKTNLIEFTNDGNQTHTFRSKKVRRIIDRIIVNNSGSGYDKHQISVRSNSYPVNSPIEIYSGVNVENNYIYSKNHNLKNGDILEYISNGTVISGLSTTKSYKVTIIDDDKFKLSDAGTATTISNTNYNRKIYVNLNSVGVGTHVFKYPDIEVNINGTVSVGQTTIIPDYFKATATPVVKGGLKSIYVEDGGVGYGVTDIINYIRQPEIKLLTGDGDAVLRPIILDGEITDVDIVNGGTNYTTPPNLKVVGVGGTSGTSGQFAELKSVITDGKITDVIVIESGSGYSLNDTLIDVIPTGSGAIINSKLHEWQINAVERYNFSLNENNSQLLQVNGELSKNNKICSFYPVKKYRRLLRDNIDSSLTELTDNHSKIVGWSYDGNPIYGPVGERTGIGFTFMKSSYVLNPVADTQLRPSNYQSGFFIEDYTYNQSGDLDENNGKFVINSDFPEGTYAYFSTIDNTTKNPSFPYITFSHRDATDQFNYITDSKQTDEIVNSGDYKRNVTHLGLNDDFRRYPLLQDSLDSNAELKVSSIKSSTITGVKVDQFGSNYKVNDKLNFNDPTISAKVDQVIGKTIVSVETTNKVVNNLTFVVNDGKVTGISTLPHGLFDGDIIQISGITSTSYKNIEGIKTVGVTTVSSGLSTNIANDSTTGITTFVTFSDSTISRKFKVDDVVQIGTEKFLILGHDDVNNRYRVRRGYDDSSSSTHSAGSIATKLQTEFTYSIPKKIKNKNAEPTSVSYFEATKSVGIGTTTTKVVVGFAGSLPINKSIPAKAIYLPNHNFKSGDEVKLISIGSTITGTKNLNLSNAFDLAGIGTFYCSKISDDFIGLSTEKVSFKTNKIFFTSINSSVGDDNKIEKITEKVSGFARRVDGTVTVSVGSTSGQQHGLSVNDEFKLHITSDKTQTFNFRYNSTIGKLVVNPLSFLDSAIGTGTTNSRITISDHDFQTGDLIIYNSSNPASPLVNDGVYYVIKDSINTIRLAENSFDLSTFPINYVSIASTGGQDHEISKINPKLTFYKNNIINFVTSDSSLTDFEIDFYNDENFKSKYNSDLITKTSSNILISVGSSLSTEFFYKIQGKNTNYGKTLFLPVDERVPDYAKIEVKDSLFNTKHRVTGIGSTTFNFNPRTVSETNSYTNSGFSSAFYSTSSTGEIGGIYSVKVLSDGINVDKLPIITSIGTTTGVNAVLSVETDDIGSANDTKVSDQGLEFSPDKTLKPKADSNVILELKDTLTLESIGISSGGINYISPPNVLAIGKTSIIAQTSLTGSSVSEVRILTNESGLSEDLRIIPTTNSNGIVVTAATTDSNKTVKLSLRAPIPDSGSDSGFYNNAGQFPFAINDEIFVENIKITDDADGYNSSDYDYTYFKVTGITTTGGQEAVFYSLVGLGTTGGLYQIDNNFGRVIKKDDLAVFTPVFKRTSFIDEEVVKVDGRDIFATVSKNNGWNQVSETLKVFNPNGDFIAGDKITGTISNNKGTVTKQFKFDFDLNVDSTAVNFNGWKDDIGKLNLDVQNIHDNDFYQRFSYSIKGEVPYDTWKDSVDSLGHVAGFKNFCNLGIGTTANATEGKKNLRPTAEGQIDFDVDINEEVSVHEKFYYDMVGEDTDDEDLSKLVIFRSKIITDYNESVSNKVLLIEDISSQFTGIVTSTGGGVIGTTSFNVFTGGNSLFHREFNPSGIDTANGRMTISDHNFNTGERLIYKPHTGQSPIGIGITSDTNTGVAATTLLPSEIFAIKIDSDTIQVAIAASFASAGVAVTFTNVIGIGNTNTVSVPPDDATIRGLISIDNMIQSPVGFSTVVSVGLSTAVGLSTDIIFLNDVSEIAGKSLLKIEDEIIKVNLVGVGSTNSLNVVRGEMGTVSAAHTVGAAVTVVKGDYRIKEGRIYFSEAPYGPTASSGIVTFSTFSGRAYYRLSYDTNAIIDDISDRFDGSTDKFDLTSKGTDISGITNSFGAFLINNIFQKPFYGDVGDINKSDYRLVGTGQTIDFTGTAANKDLPKGGIINEFDVGIGSAYQVPRKAIFTAVVSAGGTIQSVGIESGGAGYLSPPLVSVAATDRHFTHIFISSAANSVNVTGGSQLTPTGATYISETGLLTLTIANHGLTSANTVTLDNNSLIFRCSRDNFVSDHPYPRATDPASGQTLQIIEFTTNTITLDVGVGGGIDAILTASVTAGVVTAITIVNPGTGYTNTGIATSFDFVTTEPPSPYKNIPLSGGNGSGAKMDVVVGTGGSIVSFDMSDRGKGYEIEDNLQLTTLPFQVGIGTSAFNITVKNRFQDKFAGWCFGQLLELDDFSAQFNGFRRSFLITRTIIDKEYYSIVAREGSGIILQNNFLIFINDILQKPGQDYEFEKGTRMTFREAPKPGSKFKMYFYTGSSDDFETVDIDETIKPGDELKLQYFSEENVNSGIVTTTPHNLIETVTVVNSGTGYSIGQEVELLGGSDRDIQYYRESGILNPNVDLAKLKIDSITPDGGVLGVTIINTGALYTAGLKLANLGTGEGLTVRVTIDEDSKVRTESRTTIDKESKQDNRVVYELIASDTVETTTYSGVGISTDGTFSRPTMWRKQTEDLIIDGQSMSKERNYLEPKILPTTGITKSITPTDTKIYVQDTWLFQQVDNLGQTQNSINIVGLGTTAVVEKIEKVTYNGDYGIVCGIGLSATGINTTGPAIFFEIKPDPLIYSPSPGSNQISKSGITTGDYFVIKNTFIGSGVTGIKTTSSGPETVSIGNSFLDNVYYAADFVSVGSSIVRVFANVTSISGINTAGLSTYYKSGNYSWGSINVSRSVNSKPFTFHNQNGLLGIETSTQIIRTRAMRTSYT